MNLARIEGDKVIIEIDCEHVLSVVEYGLELRGYQGVVVTNGQEFVEEIISSLNSEEEDGRTLVLDMLIRGAVHAIEYGCEGVEHD